MNARLLVLMLVLSVGLVGCSDDDDNGGTAPPTTGTIVIDPQPAGIDAPWGITGPGGYSANSAGQDELTGRAPGDYTVAWGEVGGYTNPSGSTETLAAGETITFTGVYTEAFSIRLQVSDGDGAPVAGVAVGAMPAVPEGILPGGPVKSPRSAPTIPFTLPRAGLVRLEIRDVADDLVRVLISEQLAAGSYLIGWDGHDDNGATAPPGYYHVVYLHSPDADDQFEEVDRKGILQANFDPGDYSYGTTNDDGELVITDRYLVPAFYSPPTMHLRGETQEDDLGEFDVIPEIWFYFELHHDDPPVAWSWWAVLEDVVDGPQTFSVDLSRGSPPRGFVAMTKMPHDGDDPRPPEDFELGFPYPNPFN